MIEIVCVACKAEFMIDKNHKGRVWCPICGQRLKILEGEG